MSTLKPNGLAPSASVRTPIAIPVSPECRGPTNHKALLTGIEGDLRKSGEPENPRRRWRYVDNATAHERTTIVDGDNHRASSAPVRDRHLAAERQRAVGRGKRFAI